MSAPISIALYRAALTHKSERTQEQKDLLDDWFARDPSCLYSLDIVAAYCIQLSDTMRAEAKRHKEQFQDEPDSEEWHVQHSLAQSKLHTANLLGFTSTTIDEL